MNSTFYWRFVDTLVFNIATIAAIVVGIVSFTYRNTREWYADGGKQVMINNACKFMAFVNRTAEKIYYTLEDADTAAA